MIKVKVPVYMINKNDKIKDEETCAVFEIKYKDRLLEIIDEMEAIIPYTVADWVDDKNNIKRNIIFVQNNKILNKSKFDEVVFNENDTLEVLTQFAGG